jgi:hypothetical protein
MYKKTKYDEYMLYTDPIFLNFYDDFFQSNLAVVKKLINEFEEISDCNDIELIQQKQSDIFKQKKVLHSLNQMLRQYEKTRNEIDKKYFPWRCVFTNRYQNELIIARMKIEKYIERQRRSK